MKFQIGKIRVLLAVAPGVFTPDTPNIFWVVFFRCQRSPAILSKIGDDEF